MATRFRDQVGLSPKAAAGVVRFERAAADLGRRPRAEVAVAHGYADQSHLTREVVRYAGEPPRVLEAARRPTAYTASGSGRTSLRAVKTVLTHRAAQSADRTWRVRREMPNLAVRSVAGDRGRSRHGLVREPMDAP